MNTVTLRRILFAIIFLIASHRILLSQPMLVSVLLPLDSGEYVDYNTYDTTTAGMVPTKSHASYTVLSSGLSFQGTTGVSLVRDSLGSSNTTGVHDLHYRFTGPGDLQVFADTAMLASILPAFLIPGISQPPNTWVDKYKTSLGAGIVYPVMVINTYVQGVGVQITITGKYVGVDSVVVPCSRFATAYLFEIIADVKIGGELGHLTQIGSDWLVPRVGVVKTNLPMDSTKMPSFGAVTVGGREQEMTDFGPTSASVTSTDSMVTPPILIYPDPAIDAVTLSLNHDANQIMLYDDAGRLTRSFMISSDIREVPLWVKGLPGGAYLVRIRYTDGSSQSSRFIIQH